MVVEDAAQGVNAFYDGRALGSIGHLGCYSFHETKNYICGEGGALCINDPALLERAEIIRDKGTNRKQFFRGEVDKYTWVDVGSSYVPSEICSAFLYGQLELLDTIADAAAGDLPVLSPPPQTAGSRRVAATPADARGLHEQLPHVLRPAAGPGNARRLAESPQARGIHAVFHYVPLHSSPMGRKFGYCERDLPVTEEISGRLLRLPFYYEISNDEQVRVVEEIGRFYAERKSTRKMASLAGARG